jgi:hypothetical protein
MTVIHTMTPRLAVGRGDLPDRIRYANGDLGLLVAHSAGQPIEAIVMDVEEVLRRRRLEFSEDALRSISRSLQNGRFMSLR